MPATAPDRSKLRILFGGTPEFAARHLQALLDADCQLAGVFTQPDRPTGRGKKLVPGPVKTLALAHHLPVFQPASLKSPEAMQLVRDVQADVFVVVAYGLIVPQAVLAMPRHGCINVHASLLPRWRGAAPIQRAIEAGDTESGVTIMQMDAGLDTGAMLMKATCSIDPDETGGSLHDKLARLGPPALLATLDAIAADTLRPTPQADTLATYAAKISKGEAEIDWRQPAALIERKIRAFNPFPVAFTPMDGEPLRIWFAEAILSAGSSPPGIVVEAGPAGIVVACGEGMLRLREIQMPGRKRLPVAQILRGHPHLFRVGHHLGSR